MEHSVFKSDKGEEEVELSCKQRKLMLVSLCDVRLLSRPFHGHLSTSFYSNYTRHLLFPVGKA